METQVTVNGEFEALGLAGRVEIRDAGGNVLAAIEATYRETPRGTRSYYDRHRICKGDLYEGEDSYRISGDLDTVLNAVVEALPQPFADSKFKRPRAFAEDFERWDTARALCGGGWYGNTPKKTIREISRFWATKPVFTIEAAESVPVH